MEKQGTGALPQNVAPLAELMRLLSDKTRLNILMVLSQGERNVKALCHELGLPQPTVSHHLGLLLEKNLIWNRRSGKMSIYALNGRIDAASPGALEIACQPFTIRITESGEAP